MFEIDTWEEISHEIKHKFEQISNEITPAMIAGIAIPNLVLLSTGGYCIYKKCKGNNHN